MIQPLSMLSYFAHHVRLKYILLSVSFLYNLRTQLSTFVVKVTWWNTTKKEIEKLRVGSLPFLFTKCHVRAKRCQKKRQVVDKNSFFSFRSSFFDPPRSKIDTRETQWGWSRFVGILNFYAPTISRRNVILLDNEASESFSWKPRRGIKNQMRLHKPWRFLDPLHWKERAG